MSQGSNLQILHTSSIFKIIIVIIILVIFDHSSYLNYLFKYINYKSYFNFFRDKINYNKYMIFFKKIIRQIIKRN
jgi:hypothetical protein